MFTLMARALAGEPVVMDGVEASEALERASFATGRARQALETWPAADLARDFRVEGGSVSWCAGLPTDQASLGYLLERIDAAAGWADYDKAQQALDEATALLTCARTAPAQELARLHLLRGVVSAGQGREEEASAAFAQAHQADPSLVWDEGWPAGREQFEQPSYGAGTVRGYGLVTLDGLALGPEGRAVLPGLHLVTVGDRTGTLQTTLAPVEIVDGSGLADLRFSDPLARASAAGILAGRFGQGTPVLVVSRSAVWSAPAGDPRWEKLEQRKKSALVPVGTSMLAAGAAVVLVTAPMVLSQQARARQAARDMSDPTGTEAFVEAKELYADFVDPIYKLRWVPVAGGAVGVAGGALLGVGILVGPRSVRP